MERTRIITATITIIEKNPKDTGKPDNKVIADALKKQLKADDVLVSSVKDFMLEGKEEPKKPAAKKTTVKKESTKKTTTKKTSTKKEEPAKKTTTKKAAPKKETEKAEPKKKRTTKKEN